MSDIIDRLEKSMGQTGRIVKGVSPDQYEQPTPCADWDVRAVVNHVIGAMTMMATAIDEGSVDVEKLFTHRWRLDQAEEAYRLFDTQTTGKGVILPS